MRQQRPGARGRRAAATDQLPHEARAPARTAGIKLKAEDAVASPPLQPQEQAQEKVLLSIEAIPA